MSVSLKNNQLSIKDIVIENDLVAEYLSSLPASERESAVIRALGIGIMAEMKGEISHFLRETEGELGKHLSSLKALYDLRELRFRETSGKGAVAEGQVLEVVREFASVAGFDDDEVIDASTTSGAIRNNKTGDVLVRVDGDPDCVIGIEVKLDKGVRLGELADRDPTAKTDTAASQLIETAANRNSRANIIVFDEDSVDGSVQKRCAEGVAYLGGIGFVVIVSTRRNDYATLAMAYALARDFALSEPKQGKADPKVLSFIVERLMRVLNDYSDTRTQAENIIKSARKIIHQSEKTRQLVEHTGTYLERYLASGVLTQRDLLDFYQSQGVSEKLLAFDRSLDEELDR